MKLAEALKLCTRLAAIDDRYQGLEENGLKFCLVWVARLRLALRWKAESARARW